MLAIHGEIIFLAIGGKTHTCPVDMNVHPTGASDELL